MADIYYNALPTKATASVPADKVLIIDSVDGLVKQQAATQFVWPAGAKWPQGDPGGAWWTITGTLADQTDLQTALDDRVPYSGATNWVDLWANVIQATGMTSRGYVDWGTVGGDTFRIDSGTLSWDVDFEVAWPWADVSLNVVTQGAGTLKVNWVAVGGGLAWGDSISPWSGTGITLTTTDLAWDKPFITKAHTASGTLTANTTTQSSLTMSRTYTLTSGSVTDNYIGQLFSRTNVTTGAGGTLISQGSVVNITGTDTQTAGTLTPSYHLLKLDPSLRSTGSSIFVNVANSVATAPTNGHVYTLFWNTQTVNQIAHKIDLWTAARSHTGLLIKAYNASFAQAIQIDGSNTWKGYWIIFTDCTGFTNLIVNSSNSVALTNKTSDLIFIEQSRLGWITWTIVDDFDFLHLKRTSRTDTAGRNMTATGSVAFFENITTQTAGTLTDTVAVLKLTQDNDSVGGHILFNAYSWTPTVNNTMWYDGTDFKYKDNAGTTKTITAV